MISNEKLFFLFKYLSHPPWDTGITPPELKNFVAEYPPGRALDLGCGTGTNAIYLAKNGWQTTGVDFVRRAIQTARRKASREGLDIQFLVDDVSRLKQIKGSFDLVLDIGCLHSLSNTKRKNYYKNLSHLLVPQGVYLLYAFVQNTDGEGGGLGSADINQLKSFLVLLDRQMGTDRGRPSAWFTWQHTSDLSIERRESDN